jgi:hypothetical protein
MGGGSSRPKPIDPIFIQKGCMGLTTYNVESDRLNKAPFLFYRFSAASHYFIIDIMISIMSSLGKGNTYGPIFLLTAYNPQTNIMDNFLYFPSMTKEQP